jgi:hypothetical protein
MIKYLLQIRANLEGVSELRMVGDIRFFIKIKCTSCGCESAKWHEFELTKEFSDPASNGFGFVVTCKLCYRENLIKIQPDFQASYLAADSRNFKTIAALDCQGLEPISFEPRSGWIVKSDNVGLIFSNIDLSLDSGDWCGYDVVHKRTVCIFDFESRFVKI